MSHQHSNPFGSDPTAFLRGLADWGRHGGPMGGHFGMHARARRGDTRTAILRVLAESPMHGYQIIQELKQRSGGVWTPSAGSIYPTLQLLADEGLVIAEETSGKKVFSLTEAGSFDAFGARLMLETAGMAIQYAEHLLADDGP